MNIATNINNYFFTTRTTEKNDLKLNEIQHIKSLKLNTQANFYALYENEINDNTIYNCLVCHNELQFIDSAAQVLTTDAEIGIKQSWIETKNQYYCDKCKMFVVYTIKKYIFFFGIYETLITFPICKYEYDDHEDIYKFRLTVTNWKGKCVVCQRETYPIKNKINIKTYKNVKYENGYYVCVNCNLCHYVNKYQGD